MSVETRACEINLLASVVKQMIRTRQGDSQIRNSENAVTNVMLSCDHLKIIPRKQGQPAAMNLLYSLSNEQSSHIRTLT